MRYMFKCTVSQHRSVSLPDSNTGIRIQILNLIKRRPISFMLKAFKVVCTAGCNLSALYSHAQWRQQQTADVSVPVNHADSFRESTSVMERRLCETGLPGRRLSIKDQQRASPVDYRGLICHRHMTDLVVIGGWATECVWRGEVACVWEEERWCASTWVRAAFLTKSILLDFSCGHWSFPTIVLLGDWLQNFNKSSPANYTQSHSLLNAPLWRQIRNFRL